MLRKAVVSGQFYPDKKESLLRMIEEMINKEIKKEKAIALISPHAGYIYSGKVAGAVFSSAYLPQNFLILGPNHTSIGASIAIYGEGEWETPLGRVQVNKELADLILKNSSLIENDPSTHFYEHSIEVQLPFIQYFVESFSFVPILVSSVSYSDLEEVGINLAQAIKEFEDEVMIISSTDFSHYVSQEIAEQKDNMAIQEILNLNPKGLYEIVMREDISMCGYAPTAIALKAGLELGAEKAELIKYSTSGDVSGDYSQVVGYAGIRISPK
ncbi:MAG: AmmeMemoRadiSam system protein B [Candidatus Aminicenantia bacterium]